MTCQTQLSMSQSIWLHLTSKWDFFSIYTVSYVKCGQVFPVNKALLAIRLIRDRVKGTCIIWVFHVKWPNPEKNYWQDFTLLLLLVIRKWIQISPNKHDPKWYNAVYEMIMIFLRENLMQLFSSFVTKSYIWLKRKPNYFWIRTVYKNANKNIKLFARKRNNIHCELLYSLCLYVLMITMTEFIF